jgi:23S rRNA pseudouridine1911/1915/1917 synthase
LTNTTERSICSLKVSKAGNVSNVSNGERSPFDTFGTSDTSDTFSTFDTFYQRAGIVHRLDKETSGILLTAKSPEAFENLQKQFKERKIKKTYIAFVHGKVEPGNGEINVPVGRLPWNRKRFGVLAGGREAVTKYRVIQNSEFRIQNERLTLLELYPETGRTHQIRVHLKYFNHPIFADLLYAGRKTARNDRKLLPRIFLHAAKISFCHPKRDELVSFESPLPEELQDFLDLTTSSDRCQ